MPNGSNQINIVSILICSRDRRHDLESLVNTLTRMQTAYDYEIIVVEETDDPTPIDGVIYVPHLVKNRGIPFARNLALKNSNGEIIVFVDDDCQICAGWLDKLLSPFNDDTIVGVQGGVTVPDETNAIGWCESILGVPGGGIRRVLHAGGQMQETREISTLNCAYRRLVVDKVGGFEKKLKITGEDYLLAKQACNYGKCVFVPDALVSHDPRGSLKKIWHWFIRRGRAEVDVIRTGKQSDTTYWTELRSSILLKMAFLTVLCTVFSGWVFYIIPFMALFYGYAQYRRVFWAWRRSQAPLNALAMLPLVKITMDVAMDWGRIRGIVFD